MGVKTKTPNFNCPFCRAPFHPMPIPQVQSLVQEVKRLRLAEQEVKRLREELEELKKAQQLPGTVNQQLPQVPISPPPAPTSQEALSTLPQLPPSQFSRLIQKSLPQESTLTTQSNVTSSNPQPIIPPKSDAPISQLNPQRSLPIAKPKFETIYQKYGYIVSFVDRHVQTHDRCKKVADFFGVQDQHVKYGLGNEFWNCLDFYGEFRCHWQRGNKVSEKFEFFVKNEFPNEPALLGAVEEFKKICQNGK